MMHSGRNAVVTGAARGLGRAIALRLAKEGANVSIWDLNESGLRETESLVKALGVEVVVCAGDCANEAFIADAVAKTQSQLGMVHILVNNAALSPFRKFPDVTPDLWDELMRINLKGPYLCARALLPDMLTAGWGRIVNIASSAAQTGGSSSVDYAASKGGVIGFTKALAVEHASSGVTVNCVPPGFVDTEGLQESPVVVEDFASTTPMKRPGRPENIAAAVVFLTSDDADYITGHTLSVNGGRYNN